MTDANMENSPMSKHATSRCQQRGIRQGLVQTVLEHHDVDVSVGGNCRVLRVSRKYLRSQNTGLDPQRAKQLEKLCVIWSDNTNSIVTVMHDLGTHRRYRRAA